MILKQLICSLALVLCVRTTSTAAKVNITIAAVLSNDTEIEQFQLIAAKYSAISDEKKSNIQLRWLSRTAVTNPITALHFFCSDIIPFQPHIIIVSDDVASKLVPASLSYTCAFYEIPIISISSRENVFSDKLIHRTFMRTVPPYSHQTEGWLSLLTYFQWRKVVLLHSSTEESRMMLTRFHNGADKKKIDIEAIVEFPVGESDYSTTMAEFKGYQSRVFILYAEADEARVILKNAAEFNLTETGFAWIVTEQLLQLPELPVGALGLRLVGADNRSAHLNDAVRISYESLEYLYVRGNLSQPDVSCANKTNPAWSDTAAQILKQLTVYKVDDGQTGVLAFSSEGDRISATYGIVNRHPDGLQQVGNYKISQTDQGTLAIKDNDILWPGNTKSRPEGIAVANHLRVVTIEEKPFVFVRPGSDCDTQVEVLCPKPSPQNRSLSDPYCCRGYCIDLLLELARKLNFSYSVHLVADGMYGAYESKNGSKKTWNGLVGELLDQHADIIVAPLTINPERADNVAFTKPFKYIGITILVKKNNMNSNLVSFMQPFKDKLWVMVLLSVHVVALVLYLLDRFSPFGKFKSSQEDGTEEDALNLSRALWFSWGVLLNSGIGEGTPRSFSARVLGMVWAGFAMIMVASYTANLAAFLVLDRPDSKITGINDARLRNPQEGFYYATVKGTYVDMYFKRQVELSTMYRIMESRNYESAEKAIQDVLDDKLQAFIWESSRLEYEAAQHCDLILAGELFGRSSNGLALRKGDPWVDKISMTILTLHENGFMEDLDMRWILSARRKCPESDSSPATLGLTNMAGVFILVAGGIVAGIFLIFIEIAYMKHKDKKMRQQELARHAMEKWRRNIQKRKTKEHVEKGPVESLERHNERSKGTPDEVHRPYASTPNATPNATGGVATLRRNASRNGDNYTERQMIV